MSSLISCDTVLNRSKIPVPRGTSIMLQFLFKIWPNLAQSPRSFRTKTASQLINELTSGAELSFSTPVHQFSPLQPHLVVSDMSEYKSQ